MATPAQVDYDSLAQKYGASQGADYDSLAQKHGGESAAEAPPGVPMPKPDMKNASFAQDYSMEAPETMDRNFQRDPKGFGVSDADRGTTARGVEGELGKEAISGAAGAIAPPAIRGAAAAVTRYPNASRLIGSAAISQARRIPYVGKFIPPYAEMAPFLIGGGAAEPIPEEPVAAPTEAPPPTIAAPPASAPIAARPNLPAPYATEDQAWRRFAQPGTTQDTAETNAIQDNVRNQADAEHRGMLSRGTEEGFAKNTRPRTSKGDLGKQFQSAKPSAPVGGTGSPAVDLNSADNLQDLLRRSLEIAKKAKTPKQ